MAREKRDEMRRLLLDGIDPSENRKAAKQFIAKQAINTFKAVTLDWHDKKTPHLSPNYRTKILKNFEYNVFRWLGDKPIAEITSNDILSVLRQIEARKANEMAHRTLTKINQVFRYAKSGRLVKENPCEDLRESLIPVAHGHFHAVTKPDELSTLLRLIDSYQDSTPVVRCALKLLPLIFLRTGELRKMEWKDVNLKKRIIEMPANKMKMKKDHIIPLSTQAMTVLYEILQFTGAGNFVFPNAWDRDKPMCENAILAVLYKWGYKGKMTGHGFRSTACTNLQKLGFLPDIIDLQLAHNSRRGKSWEAYNRTTYLSERTHMMQVWADFLTDLLQNSSKIVFIDSHQNKTIQKII